MSRKSGEQIQPTTSSVTFRVPDFVDADGIEYTDIEVIVEMDSDIRDTVQPVKTLERPLFCYTFASVHSRALTNRP